MISSIVNKFASSSTNRSSRKRSKSVTPTSTSSSSSSSSCSCNTNSTRIIGVGVSPSKSAFFKSRKHSQSSQISARILREKAANLSSTTTTDVRTLAPAKFKMNYSSFMYSLNGVKSNTPTCSSRPKTPSAAASVTANHEARNNYENAENIVAQSLYNGNGHHNGNNHYAQQQQQQPVVTSTLIINNGHNLHQQHKPMEVELEKISLKQESSIEQLPLSSTNRIHSDARFADEPEYRMEHPRRGYAVIINNKYFDSRLELASREGIP